MTAYYNENDKHAAAWLRELIKRGLIADGVVDERSIEDASPEFLWSSELVDATKITKALKALIKDLELRAGMKRGDEKDVVDVGQGVYIQAKDALATLNFTEEKS